MTKTAFLYNMKKKILCFCLTVICLFCFASCGVKEDKLPDKTPYVAVVTDSNEYVAGKEFGDSIGGELIQYASTSDAVTAVQNGKAEYVILNEYEAQSFIDAGCELALFEKCDYKLEYRAIFNIGNEELMSEFNGAIRSLSENGTLDEIKNVHIKGDFYEIPVSSGEKGELTMICDPIFENRVFYDENNNIVGTDVDIAKTICAKLGYRLVIEVDDFDLMFRKLQSGDADFIMSSAVYTAERAENFIFSDVYSTYEYNVYVRK